MKTKQTKKTLRKCRENKTLQSKCMAQLWIIFSHNDINFEHWHKQNDGGTTMGRCVKVVGMEVEEGQEESSANPRLHHKWVNNAWCCKVKGGSGNWAWVLKTEVNTQISAPSEGATSLRGKCGTGGLGATGFFSNNLCRAFWMFKLCAYVTLVTIKTRTQNKKWKS